MKPSKKTWLSFFNKSLSVLLALLGFGSCESSGGLVMYGMPPARYSVKANVLDENNNPVPGIRVEVKPEANHNHVMASGLTDANGVFVGKVYDARVNVVYEDVDGYANGAFEKDSVQADVSAMEDSRFEFTIKMKSKV